MLEQLYSQIEHKQYDAAWDTVFHVLHAFEKGEDFSTQYVANRIDQSIVENYRVLAEYIYTLFMAERSELSETQFYKLALYQAHLHAIFEVAQMDLLEKSKAQFAEKLKSLKKNQLTQTKKFKNIFFKYLLCLSFQCGENFHMDWISEADKKYFYASLLGLLASRCFISTKEFLQYQFFLKYLDDLEKITLSDHLIPVMARVWYHLSYDEGDQKYHVMKKLNQVAKKWLFEKIKLPAENHAKNIEHSPQKVVVILEQFKSNHAIYRCFLQAIIALKEKFYVIGVCEENCIDAEAESHFNEIIKFTCHVPNDVCGIIKKIQHVQPDIIYFTSVGMQYWSWLLANIRLAPKQLASPGHTATTCSEAMDYMLIHRDFYSPDAFFSEKVILLPENTYHFEFPKAHISAAIRETTETIVLVIPGNHVKLNPSFIRACEMIQEKTTRKIIFSFLPYLVGLKYHQFKNKILSRLPACIYPAADYETYLTYLKTGDICLGTFPFGGTNTTMDAFRLCIPYVGFDSKEVTCSDAAFMRRVGLPESLIAKSVSDYVDIIVRLISEDAWRLDIAHHLEKNAQDLGGIFEKNTMQTAYADAVFFAMDQKNA